MELVPLALGLATLGFFCIVSIGNRKYGQELFALVGIASLIATVTVFGSMLNPLELNNGTYLFVEEFVPKKESGVVYIKVARPGWFARYLYRVECEKMINGCPSWPKKFKIVDNEGGKFAIVELVTPNEK